MLEVHVHKLAGGASHETLRELETVYRALRDAAARENDLRTWLAAEVTLASLDTAHFALDRPQNFMGPARYYMPEATDSIETLFEYRCRYVYNAACAA